jgi:hypothetical protein
MQISDNKIFNTRNNDGQAAVAHTYNPNYSGHRDQEDCDSKPVWGNGSRDLILKITYTKNGWQDGSSGRVPAWET